MAVFGGAWCARRGAVGGATSVASRLVSPEGCWGECTSELEMSESQFMNPPDGRGDEGLEDKSTAGRTLGGSRVSRGGRSGGAFGVNRDLGVGLPDRSGALPACASGLVCFASRVEANGFNLRRFVGRRGFSCGRSVCMWECGVTGKRRPVGCITGRIDRDGAV